MSRICNLRPERSSALERRRYRSCATAIIRPPNRTLVDWALSPQRRICFQMTRGRILAERDVSDEHQFLVATYLRCRRREPGASAGGWSGWLPEQTFRRLLLHVLPKGFHRIRHYGLFASANRAESIATARALLGVAKPAADPQKPQDTPPDADAPRVLPCPCSRCGARMIVIEVFARGCEPRWRPTPSRIDTS
jgi:hypothetical protein